MKMISNRFPADAPPRPPAPGRAGPELLQSIEHIQPQADPRARVAICGNGNPTGRERFRFLAHRLYQIRQTRRLSTILVTSAMPKEGKTVVAVNLALVLARKSGRVLLIDADLRDPTVHRMLGVPGRKGLAEVLSGQEELPAALRFVEGYSLFCLPGGADAASPSELIQGPRTSTLLAEAAAAFEWVIVDSPPLNLFADSAHLSGACDATLVVVRFGATPKEELADALSALDGAFVAGLVLNAHEGRQDDAYYRYYSRYPAAGNGSGSNGHGPEESAPDDGRTLEP